METMEKAKMILEQPVCDHCLGRQFAQLLHGYSNDERGKVIRQKVAMSIDMENDNKEKDNIDMSNFSDFTFHNIENKEKKKKCSICENFFDNIDKWAEKIAKEAKEIEFSTFLVGTKLSDSLLVAEENLWSEVGIDYCEPIKAEINREIGKRLEKIFSKTTKAKAELKRPEVSFIIDLSTGKIDRQLNPVFFYGEYQKLKRGIPQTKWPDGKYKTSVEQIIAKPFMTATKGTMHKLHGMGREDIDARCLGWRPFVLEILEPKKRKMDIKKLVKKIGKQVKVRNMRPSMIDEVRKIKEAVPDKSYTAIVKCKEGFTKEDLKKLKKLKGEIKQWTPERVLHRRANLKRKRKVIKIEGKINKKDLILEVRGTSGLYIKELISGDNGRTKPSLSEILGKECKCKELDVVQIHIK